MIDDNDIDIDEFIDENLPEDLPSPFGGMHSVARELGHMREYANQYKEKHGHHPVYQVKAVIRSLLGSKCKICGTTESLHIHHVEFNGGEERKKFSSTLPYYRNIRRNIKKGNKDEYELLCAPCHRELHRSEQ